VLVIKIGGGAAIDEAAYARFAADLRPMVDDGERIVVVHGANAAFSRLSEALGMPPRMITNDKGASPATPTARTMDAMLMTYCGKVNKTIVAAFQAAGVNAVGLSAMDGRIRHRAAASRFLRGVEDGKPKVPARRPRRQHRGDRPDADRHAHGRGVRPGPHASGVVAERGRPINVDGDKLAIELAASLDADTLLFFSDTPGLLRDRHDGATLIHRIDAGDREAALASAEGRMAVKVEAAIKAVEDGVGKVMFADARVERPVSRALAGEGTVVAVAGR
jgi:acetylglutamate/LysW-gamma-L-alpha-aminoadipate kinase